MKFDRFARNSPRIEDGEVSANDFIGEIGIRGVIWNTAGAKMGAVAPYPRNQL